MADSRSRPQYGEYASPEDQAKAIRVPVPPPEQAPLAAPAPGRVTGYGAGQEPSAGPWARPGQQGDTAGQQGPGQQGPGQPGNAAGQPGLGQPADAARRMVRTRDMGFTAALLAIGLFWVIVSIPGMADLPATIQQTYAMQGYTGKYGPVALGATIGLVINISQLVLWAVTCGLSVLAIRKGRRAFYIPLAGGAVSGLVVMVLTIVAMLNDPGLLQYLSTLG
jgi:hypothetical protein